MAYNNVSCSDVVFESKGHEYNNDASKLWGYSADHISGLVTVLWISRSSFERSLTLQSGNIHRCFSDLFLSKSIRVLLMAQVQCGFMIPLICLQYHSFLVIPIFSPPFQEVY